MKRLKKLIVILLVIAMCASLVAISASAGTVAYGTAKVTADVLNIRSGPSTSHSIIGTIDEGNTVVVLEQTSSLWYHISYNGTDGYVSTTYLGSLSTVSDFSGTGTVTGYAVRIRSDAGTSSSILGSLDSGTSVTILGIKNGWYKIQYSGTTGYMRSDYISLNSASGSAAPDDNGTATTGTVTGDYVNIRSGASTSYSVLGMLNSGTEISVLGTSGNWYKIQYGSITGYMFSAYVSVSSAPDGDEDDDEPTTKTGIVTGNYVNIRSGAGTDYSVIGMLNSGTTVTVLATEGSWYKIQYGSITGYIYSQYVYIGSSNPGGSTRGQEIANYALQFNGYDYVYGGASPSTGFDCSGFVYYIYGQFGYSIYRTAEDQYFYSGVSVSKSDLQPGDLVFFSDDGGYSVTHVGMYIGNGQFIHASNSRVGVIISDLNSSYYTSVWYGAKRIV